MIVPPAAAAAPRRWTLWSGRARQAEIGGGTRRMDGYYARLQLNTARCWRAFNSGRQSGPYSSAIAGAAPQSTVSAAWRRRNFPVGALSTIVGLIPQEHIGDDGIGAARKVRIGPLDQRLTFASQERQDCKRQDESQNWRA